MKLLNLLFILYLLLPIALSISNNEIITDLIGKSV